jgi:hypothetical protein
VHTKVSLRDFDSNDQCTFKGWPLLGPIWQRLNDTAHDLQKMSEEVSILQQRLANLEASSNPLFFFHLAKTGGSSIWHTLIDLASAGNPPVPVIDLYHHARNDQHTVTGVYKVLLQFKELLQNKRVLIHHHTNHPVGFFFDRQPIYTTIIRDPVDRFISEINHCRAQLRGELDPLHQAGVIDPRTEMEGRGWSPRLIEEAVCPSATLESLAELALTESCMTRYYYQNFHHLLFGAPGSMTPCVLPSECPSDGTLALLVRTKFAFIGRFPQVFEACEEIARLFKLPPPFSRTNFPHMLQRHSGKLLVHCRPHFRSAFRADYAFLSELGFDFEESPEGQVAGSVASGNGA